MKNKLTLIAYIYSTVFLLYLLIVILITNKAGNVYAITDGLKCNLLYYSLYVVYFLFMCKVDSKLLDCIALFLIIPQCLACGSFVRYILVGIVELIIFIKRKKGGLLIGTLAFCVVSMIILSFYTVILSDDIDNAEFDETYRSLDGTYEIVVDDTYIHGKEAKNFILKSNKTIDLGIYKLKYRDQIIHTTKGESVPEIKWEADFVMIGAYKYLLD